MSIADEKAELSKYYKRKYQEARKEAYQVGYKMFSNGGQAYTLPMIRALKDMAEHDVWPDFTFSDEECNVWELFHKN